MVVWKFAQEIYFYLLVARGMRHTKLCEILNQPLVGVLQDKFFKEFR